MSPSLPNLPPNPLAPLKGIIRGGRQQIEKAKDEIHSLVDELHPTTEPQYNPPETPPIESGTACLPCCRDHFSTASSSLSEGMRFARDSGIKHPEVLRRIRIALDELNIMERIDLAPDETTKLGTTSERELAKWALEQSRDLRHSITAVKDAEAMEKAAAKAGSIAEEYMGKLWTLETECPECASVVERLRDYIDKRQKGEI